jgi:16S rRNA (cytosine1402-N4)-methyltransferase
VPAFDHESVLLDEVLECLDPRDNKLYVDCTVGGGGHAAAILGRAPAARLIGIDRDPWALEAATARLAPFADRSQVVHGHFVDVPEILKDLGITQVDGFLLDLGVSSPQLDHAERGFSFSKDGPLDMRMDTTRGPTALDMLRALDERELADVIFEFGEERHSRRVARLIKEAVVADQVHTTTELAAVIARGIPIAEQRKSKIHAATRTFQALRIAVNTELAQLERFLAVFPDLLAPGGRCAIISFHSLEDRLVKQRFRDLAWTSSLPPVHAARAGERIEAVCTPITRKALFAGDAELGRNPRARSARLRACERTTAANLPPTSSP